MTLTPDEAREQANATLAVLYATVTEWDAALLDQAIEAIAADGEPFSMNDLRLVLPEIAHHAAGLYFHSLANQTSPRLLEYAGDVRSINPKAHGKKVNRYTLTPAGRAAIAERRAGRLRAARAEQRKAAAA
jgi:hypothetical protein